MHSTKENALNILIKRSFSFASAIFRLLRYRLILDGKFRQQCNLRATSHCRRLLKVPMQTTDNDDTDENFIKRKHNITQLNSLKVQLIEFSRTIFIFRWQRRRRDVLFNWQKKPQTNSNNFFDGNVRRDAKREREKRRKFHLIMNGKSDQKRSFVRCSLGELVLIAQEQGKTFFSRLSHFISLHFSSVDACRPLQLWR